MGNHLGESTPLVLFRNKFISYEEKALSDSSGNDLLVQGL